MELAPRRACKTTAWEPVLARITASIFADETLLHRGSIVDCGANSGGESCFYADLDSTRTVHAIEPLLVHRTAIERYQVNRSNIVYLHGGLGSTERVVSTRGQGSMVVNVHKAMSLPSTAHSIGTTAFTVYRLDDLFLGRWRDERLAFAHFDVEGAEADVISGGMQILRRDRPIFTVEVGYHQRTTPAALFHAFRALSYQAYLVHEVSGTNVDARNLLVMPTERRPAQALIGDGSMAAVQNATHMALLASTAPTAVRGVLCTGEADVHRALHSISHGHSAEHHAGRRVDSCRVRRKAGPT